MLKLFSGLSGRLLILTVLVVMIVEVAIFVPSVSRFRLDYLQERIVRAQIAALTVMTAPQDMVPEYLEAEMLSQAGVLNIVVKQDGVRVPVLSSERLDQVFVSFDLRYGTLVSEMRDAMQCLFAYPDKVVMRIVGAPSGGDFEQVEVTLDSDPLREAMLSYGWRIFRLSLIISLITAAFVYILVRAIVVSPILHVIENVTEFRENPEDPSRVMVPSSRLGEVAEAERAVAAMQRDVLTALRERSRLASLGEALAKISHDLRNMLATGQMMVDRLEMSSDPTVARVLPKLVVSLDRAIRLCQGTLDFGRAEERAPELRKIRLAPLARDVAEGMGLTHDSGQVRCKVMVPESVEISADPEQLYRVLANLIRNAEEAIRSTREPGEIRIDHARARDQEVISVVDDGPGMPLKAREHLFEAFRGGARQGGTGLGLAIAQDLVRGHGGRLELADSTTEGTEFRILLPAVG
ncbi:MAG: HAMP domain-containing sensor histidine kinase [Pseudomonadota bacterium]